MAEEKKNEEEKSSATKKATTGAWWKSTVVEEKEEKTSPTTQQAPTATAENDQVELAVKKPSRKRTPKKSTAKADETPTDIPSDEAVATNPKPRKRTPRKKKAVVESAAAGIAAVQTQADTAVDSATVVEVEAADAGKPVVSVEHPGDRLSAPKEEAVSKEGTEDSPEAEPVPKKPSRKRPARRKKPAAEAAPVAAEVTAVEVATAETPEKAVVGVSEDADGNRIEEEQSEKPKRSPRKRPNRRKKNTAAAVAETAPVENVTDQVVETSAVLDEAGEVAADEEGAGDSTAEDGGQELKKRRSSSRRSRGRRKKSAQPQAETPVPVEPEEPVEDEDEYLDIDDDDLDDDDDFDERPGRTQREGYQSGTHEVESGVEIPELPDDEPEDEKENVVLKLLINAEEPEECRLALLANGRLESIHVSTINRAQTKNNIYKARIVAIEPNLQAAFVDYGTEKNGFLPFSEIHPEYYKEDLSEEIRRHVENHHWKKLSILDVVEKGQDVMVQVVKEEVGKKGANMTTYLSLPGRSVVLMPGSDSSGISRKISGEERRAQLRTAMNSLEIPEGIGWIVRTASADITKSALARDVGYLLRLWEEIKKKAQDMDGVGQVYEDHQSVLRFLREHFDPAIEEILVDDEGAMEQVKEFISYLPSKQRDVKVRLHKGSRPIFNQFSVEDQIESIYQPRVTLPSGGSIVIEPTEALVSIDVNSGSTSKGKNFDQSIYQANLEAASELARQLRLRDLGGLIIVDFIDMRNKKHIRDVERMVKQSMRRDKAKVDFTRISKFGLMQISRQKLGSPIEAGNYRVCEHCKGRGTVRSVETLALFYLRRIQTGASRKHIGRVECRFPLDVAQYLLNKKRHEIQEHESRYDTEIVIIADPAMGPTEHEILLQKAEKEVNDKKQG